MILEHLDRPRLYLLLVALAAVAVPSVILRAQEDLYDPVPPPDSAFVRVIHAAAGAPPVESQIGGLRFERLAFLETSPYRVLPRGGWKARVGSHVQEIAVEAGNFYSIALTGASGDELRLIEDPKNTNLARALVTVYNLSDAHLLDLKTADGSIPVIVDVGTGEVGSRMVNPIGVELAVFLGESRIAPLERIQLERSAAYSVFIAGAGEELEARWITNRTTP